MEEIIKPYGYIYKTTNLINGKIYIGKKESPDFDPNYKGSGKALNYAFKKHGWENFKVEYLFPCFSKEELNAEERFLIAWFDCRVKNGKGYNISEGGDWGDVSQGMTTEQYKAWCEKNRLANLGDKNHFYGKKHTEESKLKISEHHADFSGENHPMYGKSLSDETRRKISEARKNKYANDPEFRKKMSDCQKGKKVSEDTRKKISESISGDNNPFHGKEHSDFSKQKMSEAQKNRYALNPELKMRISKSLKGKHPSEETRKKMSESRKGKKYPGRKYNLVCKDCGKPFLGTSSRQKYCESCREIH